MVKTRKLDPATLHTALTLISVEYIKKSLGSSPSGTERAACELTKLKAAGLGKSSNAQILSNMTRRDNTSSVKLISEIKRACPQALIVPYTDLFRVMAQYNLSVGRIEHYTKIIPEENVDQIYEVSQALKHLELNHMRYIDSIRIDSDLPRSVTRQIAQYVARFPLALPGNWYNHLLLDHISDAPRKYDDSIRMHLSRIEQDEWLIAAPVADLPENTTIEYYSGREETRKRIAEDPIVFKASRVGAVIASMWGEEADSSIFDKYR